MGMWHSIPDESWRRQRRWSCSQEPGFPPVTPPGRGGDAAAAAPSLYLSIYLPSPGTEDNLQAMALEHLHGQEGAPWNVTEGRTGAGMCSLPAGVCWLLLEMEIRCFPHLAGVLVAFRNVTPESSGPGASATAADGSLKMLHETSSGPQCSEQTGRDGEKETGKWI